MHIEKEVRYSVKKELFDVIREISILSQAPQKSLDVYLGYYGFESLDKLGYVCRVRNDQTHTVIECKKRISNDTWMEQEIVLSSIKDGCIFLSLMGLEPYLYISKKREIRTTKQFQICLDEVSLLGDFVEIEFLHPEDCNNHLYLSDFLEKLNINSPPSKLYGDLLKDKISTDIKFKNKFMSALKEIINS